MNRRKDELLNAIGTAIVLVLFVFVFGSFLDKPFKQGSGSSRYELKAEFQSSQEKAVIAEAVPLSSFQKVCVLLPQHLFTECRNALAENQKIIQRVAALKRTRQMIKPFVSCRFYHLLLPADAEDLPVLS